MRFRLALALSASIIVIGIASWLRFGTIKYVSPSIVAVEQAGVDSKSYEDIIQELAKPKTASTTSIEGPTSGTEVISHQLISDYVDLAAGGRATESSIASLADKYVENIPTLIKATVISYSDIQIVPNTKINFQNYADTLTKINSEYTNQISKASSGKENLAVLGPDLYFLAKNFSLAYTDAIPKLKNLPVPTSLALSHLQLINSYLSSAAAMKAISETEQDSATAFAGLIILNQNLTKEDLLLNEIGKILTSNGI